MDIRRRMLMSGGGFPAEPSAYELIGKYTSAQTFTAPEDGYYQIELFGASGKGGASDLNEASMGATGASGGGGGGGAYCCSKLTKLNKGDTIVIGGSLAVGGTAKVTINSSVETYSVMKTVSGKNGGNADCSASDTNVNYVYAGTGGAGGTASGGNYSNIKGKNGSTGSKGYVAEDEGPKTISGGAGGSSGYTGGNAGGAGAKVRIIGWEASEQQGVKSSKYSAGAGKTAFVKIYRGNTNVA